MKTIKFKDYVGKIIYNEEMYDVGDFEEVYKEEFDKDSPKEVYAAKVCYTIGLDLEDELYNRANDNGYEEMGEMLDLRHPLLKQAQKLIDEWVETQGAIASSWGKDKNTLIDLTELYNEEISRTQEDLIREAVENEHGRKFELKNDVLETLKEYLEGSVNRERIRNVISDMTRRCDVCKTIMLEGFTECDGENYYCSEACVIVDHGSMDKFFGTEVERQQYEDEGAPNPNYWTDWGLGQFRLITNK